jgi:hypothetical protein
MVISPSGNSLKINFGKYGFYVIYTKYLLNFSILYGGCNRCQSKESKTYSHQSKAIDSSVFVDAAG